VLRHASLAPRESPSGLAIDIKNKKLFSACDNKMMAVTDIPTLKVVGAKLEHNDYTGFETEPTVRMIWAPRDSRPSVWAAASKAVRQPSRVDDNVQTNSESFPLSASAVAVLRLFGNPQVQAEQLRDYEVGYRSELTRTLSVDCGDLSQFLSPPHAGLSHNRRNSVVVREPSSCHGLRRRAVLDLESGFALASQPWLLLPACVTTPGPEFNRTGYL